ncbi:PREDICTED: tyrosine-protein phosphatase 10D-like [Priapulus caudatus]|uniref:Tyrosine-protein phosphatase 10D-like n=1 Tax=Priapulus caudatus TaxID=37621 RepID=A0ABM1EFU1_PRICU|nr:PREDICTED: tyrosine-protein phosphatase 10D-like [Priapulus caudatus]
MYTDTAYSSPISTLGNYVGIIAGAVVGSLLVILLLVLVVVQRRRLQCCRKTSANDKNASGSFVTHVASQGMANSPLYACSRSVKLSEFVQHVKIMGADSDFRFSEEYEALKMVGREQPSTAADLPVNRGKNRFTNILPYDHSRVKLIPVDDEDGSDYINANYMPGFNSPREYIVTQGPLPSTRDDFWRMVWEQNTRSIVMLTRCIEKGREKCDHYWPIDSEQTYYGEIQVAVLNESKYPYWTISEFKVTLDMESRVVRHFHFTAWPDFGVPEHTQTLIKFVRAMRDRAQYSPHPIIAHCSAGVGRSGTFIVIDRLIQLIKQSDTVDIFGNVYEMRKERVWMVQTEQQYICIHNSLRTVLEGREDDMPTHEYDDLGLDNKAYDDDEGIVESGM